MVTKTDDEMIKWFNNWNNKLPEKYIAFIYDDSINEPVGEIYFYLEDEVTKKIIITKNMYLKENNNER